MLSQFSTEVCRQLKPVSFFDFSVSLQTDDAGHVGATVLAHLACVVGLQTNDVRRNWKKRITYFFSVRTLVPLWEGLWSIEKQKKANKGQKAGILWVLVKCFWPTFLLGAIYQLVYVLLQFASPQILGLIINFVQSDDPNWKGYLYTIMFFIVAFLSAISDSSYWYNMRLVGLRLKTALTSTIYRKSLKLSNGSRKEQTGNVLYL